MRKKVRTVSVLLAGILLMSSTFATPIAAGQGNGRGQEKQRAQQVQYLDAEIQVIDGQPMLKVETKEGYASYEFPWPEVAIVDGREVTLERQGNYFLLQTDDGTEKVSIEDFQVALVAGQLMLVKSVNPWWTVPVAVAKAALIAAGVPVTMANLSAATLLIAAGKSVTAITVRRVVLAQTAIAAGVAVDRAVSTYNLLRATYRWIIGTCMSCGRLRTPGGSFGDFYSSACARRLGGQRSFP